jgi:hypothetical protein
MWINGVWIEDINAPCPQPEWRQRLITAATELLRDAYCEEVSMADLAVQVDGIVLLMDREQKIMEDLSNGISH